MYLLDLLMRRHKDQVRWYPTRWLLPPVRYWYPTRWLLPPTARMGGIGWTLTHFSDKGPFWMERIDPSGDFVQSERTNAAFYDLGLVRKTSLMELGDSDRFTTLPMEFVQDSPGGGVGSAGEDFSDDLAVIKMSINPETLSKSRVFVNLIFTSGHEGANYDNHGHERTTTLRCGSSLSPTRPLQAQYRNPIPNASLTFPQSRT